MAKRDPWVIINLMTGEHIGRYPSEVAALLALPAKTGFDVRFWR